MVFYYLSFLNVLLTLQSHRLILIMNINFTYLDGKLLSKNFKEYFCQTKNLHMLSSVIQIYTHCHNNNTFNVCVQKVSLHIFQSVVPGSGPLKFKLT